MPENMDIKDFAKLYGAEPNLRNCKSDAKAKAAGKPRETTPETARMDDRGMLPDHRYDSKSERQRHMELLALQSDGQIAMVLFHPLSLRLGWTDKGNASRYTPDFYYYEIESGKHVLEEVKGYRRRDWPVRSAFMKSIWGHVFELRTVQV